MLARSILGEKGYAGYMSCMNLDKAYDRIDKDALWRVLIIHGVVGKLLNEVRSFLMRKVNICEDKL